MNAPAHEHGEGSRASAHTRVLFDADGVEWEISERDCTSVPGARAPRCLVFMSQHTVRRIWSYPSNWHALSPDALLALSERRDERPPV